MTFELSPTTTTAADLRDLEQNAPNVTPKAIRAALASAATLIEGHEQRIADVARILDEALALRTSQMDSQSRSISIDRAVKNAMNQAVARLRG